MLPPPNLPLAFVAGVAPVATGAGVTGVAAVTGVTGVATGAGVTGVASVAAVPSAAGGAGVAAVTAGAGVTGVAGVSGVASVSAVAGVAGAFAAFSRSFFVALFVSFLRSIRSGDARGGSLFESGSLAAVARAAGVPTVAGVSGVASVPGVAGAAGVAGAFFASFLRFAGSGGARGGSLTKRTPLAMSDLPSRTTSPDVSGSCAIKTLRRAQTFIAAKFILWKCGIQETGALL